MNIHNQKKCPPARAFLIRNALLCFALIAFLAVPVQSQVPTRLTNPTVADLAPCGLPTSWARFNDSATVTTFNMTADCVFDSGSVQITYAFLYFTAGEFTINGNGHSIIGPVHAAHAGYVIFVDNAGTVLNLNDVIIRQNSVLASIFVRGGRLNARNIIFRDNQNGSVLTTGSSGQIYIENVEFQNNRAAGGAPYAVAAAASSSIQITNSIFQGNTGFTSMLDSLGALQLRGCVLFAGNEGTRDSARSTGITDSNTGACPAAGFSYWLSLTPSPRKKKEKIPTPTPTPRPQIAATHVALQAATGATFRTAFGLDSGAHFRQLDGAGIGVQSIIDAGYLEAFDVYGYVEQGVEVCFPQIGRVVFLDARTSPRAITALESTVVNGQTCVSINSPGSLVLLPN